MAKADSGAELYKKGNECFVSEDYDRAVDLYSSALAQDPGLLECYAAKAQALIRSEKYDQAKLEADRGIDVLRGISAQDTDSKPSDELKKCLQRSGVASFHLGRFKEAKNTFSEAKKLDDADKGITQWRTWCDEKIAKFGDDASKKSKTPAQPSEPADSAQPSDPAPTATQPNEPATIKNSTSESKQSGVEASSSATNPSSSASAESKSAETSNEMPAPKIKHDWYQTETHVIIEVRIKKLDPKDVRVEFQDVSLSVTAKLATGSDYSLELDLAHPVIPDQSSFKVLSTKLEIKLRKGEAVRWTGLEGDGSAPLPGGALPSSSAQGVKAPYASGRDWNKVEKLLEAEAEEKKEGESALNEMFQKIYADASDETKKAMNKSFSESGGTVLSTNWNEIGKGKTEVKPPDGMEHKKWD
jgi:suppressor of G2 allele of SKP1